MIKVGIYLELKEVKNVDFRTVLSGNPGVGGTSYLQILVPTCLKKLYTEYEFIIYSENQHVLPEKLQLKIVSGEEDAVLKANEDKIDIFIFIGKRRSKNFYSLIDKYNVKTIAWVHNYVDYVVLNDLYKTENIKRVIFVGQQHYDAYIDDKIIKKSSFIYNMMPPSSEFSRENIVNEKIVTYLGALHKSKGFDAIAREWKNILKAVPDAKLHVIGSGKLYDRDAKLGSYNIADERYEKKFIKYIIDKDKKILDSIKFYGMVGDGKVDIFSKTSVGVANPTGKTETFCLSATEFQGCGIPVVTYKGYGLLDTVKDKYTGILSRNRREMRNGIIYLLKNEDANLSMGQEGAKFIENQFSSDVISPLWDKEIKEVLEDKNPSLLFSYKNMWDDWKWLKYINFKVKKLTKLDAIPSLAYIVSYFKQTMKKIIYNFKR